MARWNFFSNRYGLHGTQTPDERVGWGVGRMGSGRAAGMGREWGCRGRGVMARWALRCGGASERATDSGRPRVVVFRCGAAQRKGRGTSELGIRNPAPAHCSLAARACANKPEFGVCYAYRCENHRARTETKNESVASAGIIAAHRPTNSLEPTCKPQHKPTSFDPNSHEVCDGS